MSDLAALLHEIFNVPSRGMCGGTHSIGYGECQDIAARLIDAGVRAPSDPAAPLDEGPEIIVDWTNEVIAGLTQQVADLRDAAATPRINFGPPEVGDIVEIEDGDGAMGVVVEAGRCEVCHWVGSHSSTCPEADRG